VEVLAFQEGFCLTELFLKMSEGIEESQAEPQKS
jgi:hypothetical protein